MRGKKNKEFAAPYIFSAWPDSLDAFQHDVLFGSEVPIYNKPDNTAELVAKGNYNIVKKDVDRSTGTQANNDAFPHMLGHKEWYFINNFENKPIGFVHWKNIWSPVGYRAIFSKENNQWLLRVLIAGD